MEIGTIGTNGKVVGNWKVVNFLAIEMGRCCTLSIIVISNFRNDSSEMEKKKVEENIIDEIEKKELI